MENYRSFEFLKKIYFVRTGGSAEEAEAARLIQEEIARLGESAYIEEFEVDDSEIVECKLELSNGEIVECGGSGYSGSTPLEGLTGEIFYWTSPRELPLRNIKDKIVLVTTKRISHDLYEKAVNEGAKALICCTGTVYRDDKDVDIDPYIGREQDYKLGNVPTIMIRARDAEKIVEKLPLSAKITLIAKDKKATSRNVVCVIEGSEKPNEEIVFTAHYDSVKYSKGAFDNASGSISLLQFLNYFHDNKPKRTVRFIWCGSEEMGLLGSRNYCTRHEEDIKKRVLMNFNVDMVGVTLGYDMCCITGSNKILDYFNTIKLIKGFPLVTRQGVYSSDSTPFADKGIPAISFARLSEPCGAQIHSHYDVIERLSEPNYVRTCNFIIDVTSELINSVAFPFEKEMPKEMLDELDYYNLRKKRPIK